MTHSKLFHPSGSQCSEKWSSNESNDNRRAVQVKLNCQHKWPSTGHGQRNVFKKEIWLLLLITRTLLCRITILLYTSFCSRFRICSSELGPVPGLWSLFFSEGSLSLLAELDALSSIMRFAVELEITVPLQTPKNSGIVSMLLLCQPLSRFWSTASTDCRYTIRPETWICPYSTLCY